MSIKAKNARVKIGKKVLLDDVSFEVKTGEIIAVLGANGAGKSTLLKTLCGELSLQRGEIFLGNKSLKEWKNEDLSKFRGVLPQSSDFDFPFKVNEVALLGRTPHIKFSETAKDYEITKLALEKVEALKFAERFYPTLSGGERQRVQLARVLTQIWEKQDGRQRYLLLDEPTASLDLAHQHLTLQTAREFADESAVVVVVLHDLNLAAQYADKILLLKNGKVVAFDKPTEVLRKDLIKEVFDIEVYITKHEAIPNTPLIVPIGKGSENKVKSAIIKKNRGLNMSIGTETQSNLKERYQQFKTDNPKIRIRDAADQLGVSEGELLATSVGETSTKLTNDFKDLMKELHTLGRVMALTRNEEIVHERKGVYENAQTEMPHGMALFVNPDIDLRIFTKCWHHGFAAKVETPRGTMRSLQVFDQDGSAVHKIYLTDKSDVTAYETLVEKFKSDDQTPSLSVTQKPEKKADRPDSEIDVEGFRTAWGEMKDTHDFFPMLGKFRVGRKQALRIADEKFSKEVPADSFRWLLEKASERKIPIMVFVGNDGIIQIHTGEVENVLDARGWFNVMDEDFNLHINQDEVGSAFVVRKPTEDGIVTSLELFNKSDKDIALFFGKRKPGIPEREDWRELIADLEDNFI